MVKDITVNSIIELLAEQRFDGLPEAITALLNQAMMVECMKHLHAELYESTTEP